MSTQQQYNTIMILYAYIMHICTFADKMNLHGKALNKRYLLQHTRAKVFFCEKVS